MTNKIKGEGLPSPFIFLVISLGFVNLSWAQLGSKNWFHPNPNFTTDLRLNRGLWSRDTFISGYFAAA